MFLGLLLLEPCQPLFVPIDDVASLYFFSGDSDAVVDILYLTG